MDTEAQTQAVTSSNTLKLCWLWCGQACAHYPTNCSKRVHVCSKECAELGQPFAPITNRFCNWTTFSVEFWAESGSRSALQFDVYFPLDANQQPQRGVLGSQEYQAYVDMETAWKAYGTVPRNANFPATRRS
jgi:hypothetical protein